MLVLTTADEVSDSSRCPENARSDQRDTRLMGNNCHSPHCHLFQTSTEIRRSEPFIASL